MPSVHIWPPQRRGQPVWTCRLENYRLVLHQRFWTAQVLESNESDEIHENQTKRLKRKFIKALGAVGVFKWHRGGLVFCQASTRNTKANVIPFNMKSVQQSTTTTSIPFMKEFLNYNRINAEDVTLERGEQIFKKYREYFELSAIRQAEGIIEEPRKSLARTQYSFSAELLVSEKDVESLSFYDKQQSCVSFTFNVIQTA